MSPLSPAYIRREVADSEAIYSRGVNLCDHGAFAPMLIDTKAGQFEFIVDGNYGDYTTRVELNGQAPLTSCDCPYPGEGCKHIVAVLLYIERLLAKEKKTRQQKTAASEAEDAFLSAAEIRKQALKDREKRARTEAFSLSAGEMFKGAHEISSINGQAYTVTLHDPGQGQGHCSCPDYLTNRLGTCKHLLFAADALAKKRGFKKRMRTEVFPFIDLYWDSPVPA